MQWTELHAIDTWEEEARGWGRGGETYKRVEKYCKELVAAQQKNTLMQMQVKGTFDHSEFGMTAGLPRRSCRPTQSTKAGSSAMATERIAMLEASDRLR